MTDAREKLIKELIETFEIKADGKQRKLPNWSNIADWIIEDRKRVEKEYEIIKEKAWKYDQLCK